MAKYHIFAITSAALAASAPTHAQEPPAEFRVGDVVVCAEGNMTGPIVRIEPRAGWDVPFYIVRTVTPMTTYESKCLPRTMRHVGGEGAPAGQRPAGEQGRPAAPAPMAAGAAQATASPTFRVGDEVVCDGNLSGTVLRTEPRPGWDDPFYIVHSEGSTTNNEIKCLPQRMRPVSAASVRPARQAPAPVARTAAPAATTGGRVPDGRYRCHKTSPGGQLMDIGTLVMRSGRGTLEGLPDGWTVRSISLILSNPPLVAYDYTSAAGFHDRLDCVPQ